MTEKDYSLDALNKFFDFTTEKGLLKRNTALSRKQAANKILSVLDPNDVSDLRSVDVDHAFERFTNIQGTDFTPKSLRVYRSRLKTALADFCSYVNSPSTFKPSRPQRNTAQSKKSTTKKEPQRNSKAPTQEEPTVSEQDSMHQEKHIVIPVPLRQGLTVKIHNIPPDLTEQESEKLAAIIKAYAMPKE